MSTAATAATAATTTVNTASPTTTATRRAARTATDVASREVRSPRPELGCVETAGLLSLILLTRAG